MLATEKVTRKALDDSDQKRLVEEALSEVDFSALAANGSRGARLEPMEEIARVYADALFEVAEQKGKLDEVHEQLDQFADALARDHDLQVVLLQPLLLLGGEARGIARAVSGPSRELVNFLELLAEKHRMPAILPHPAALRRALGRGEEAARGDPDERGRARSTKVVEQVGREVERQTDREIDLESEVDPEILGGLVLRVGNMVLTRACAASWKD